MDLDLVQIGFQETSSSCNGGELDDPESCRRLRSAKPYGQGLGAPTGAASRRTHEGHDPAWRLLRRRKGPWAFKV